MFSRRLAIILIWSGYGTVAVIVAAVRVIASSARMDVGQVMSSVIFLGGVGVLAVALVLVGSALGTYALIVRGSSGRLVLVLHLLAGWIGAAVLGWILWSFWTN
jgi:hypothetical protein